MKLVENYVFTLNNYEIPNNNSLILLLILVHPCDAKQPVCSQKCNKNGGAYVCSCREGFELSEDKKTCNKG